ncbi:MAG: zf-HC2 domain-containing protein [Clostridia bacterium]|nr:zf-HC2 domain-containing protein [Clostridia bacterium]
MTDFFENKCDVVRDLLPIYADHGTSSETNTLISHHIAKCEACSHYLNYIRKSNELKREQIRAEVTPDYMRFLTLLRKKRIFNRAIVASAMVVSVSAFAATAIMLRSSQRQVSDREK